MRGGNDPVGVAAFIARPAGIDQQRLPRWTDDERCLPAFDVDEVDL